MTEIPEHLLKRAQERATRLRRGTGSDSVVPQPGEPTVNLLEDFLPLPEARERLQQLRGQPDPPGEREIQGTPDVSWWRRPTGADQFFVLVAGIIATLLIGFIVFTSDNSTPAPTFPAADVSAYSAENGTTYYVGDCKQTNGNDNEVRMEQKMDCLLSEMSELRANATNSGR